MSTNRILDRIQAVVEYLVCLVFLNSAAQLFYTPSIAGKGILFMLGTHTALVVYAVWFIFWALALVYAKVKKKKKLHRNALMVLYLTTVYTAILTAAIIGVPDAIDDMVLGVIIAACWLRWKFKTEYLSPDFFRASTEHMRDDLPPRS